MVWTSGARGLLQNKWTVLVASIWIECCAGASSSFSIYSETIKTRFGYDQEQLDTISAFKDIGECVGILAGILYDRFPPWLVLLVGCLQNVIGYILLWLFVTQKLPTPALWEICLVICFAVNSQTYYNTACIVTCVSNFPANRGIVLGLLKGCLGLSSAILSRFWHVIPSAQRGDGSSFILMVAWLPSAVTFLLMPFIRKYSFDTGVDQTQYSALPYSKEDEEENLGNEDLAELTLTQKDCDNNSRKSTTVKLLSTSAPVVILAIFLLGCACWDGDNLLANRAEGVTVILILLTPLCLAWKLRGPYNRGALMDSSSIDEPFIINGSAVEDEPLIINGSAMEAGKQESPRCNSDHPVDLKDKDDNSLLGALCSLNFVLVLFTSAITLGTGFVTVDNMSQVATSLRYSENDVTIFLSLISISQFTGRFGGGVFSDYLLHRFGIARPLITAIAALILSCGYVVVASGVQGSLYFGCIVIGLFLGANWCLNPTTVSELFGLCHFGNLYNVVLIGSPLVSYVFNVWVAGYLYDQEAATQEDEEGDCSGSKCFSLTFLILGGACLLAALASFFLWIRTRCFYHTIRI
eukprot:PITA_28827